MLTNISVLIVYVVLIRVTPIVKPPKIAIVKVILIVNDVFNAKPVLIDKLSQTGRKVRPMESNMERWGEYVFSDLRVKIFQIDRQKRVSL